MKLYIVLKNRDFTEGSGPMVFDTAFTSLKRTEDYLNSKEHGVYGWKPPKGKTFAEMVLGPVENHGGWAGYEVKIVEDSGIPE